MFTIRTRNKSRKRGIYVKVYVDKLKKYFGSFLNFGYLCSEIVCPVVNPNHIRNDKRTD